MNIKFNDIGNLWMPGGLPIMIGKAKMEEDKK